MGTRKVKEAKDLETGELIYLKGHAKATYMSDGRTVEDAINSNVGGGGSNNGNGSIDLSGYATKQELDGKVDKVDGKQLSTEDFTTLLKQKLDGLSNYDDTEISQAVSKLRTDLNTLVSGDTTTAIKTFNEVIAFLDGLEDTEDLASIIASIEQQVAGKMDKVTLATVATSGNYNDLSNKPTIPSAVTESTVSGWGFTKNTGTYSKPSTGIPKSDLASAVQTSLGKADTALQSYTEQYKGTVTGVKVNGSTKSPSSGTVDIGNVVTSIKINGSTKSPSSGAVDLGTVITSHQDISGKQDKLVSGTNIKTINGVSILGSGNIAIEGGSGGSSSGGQSKDVVVVDNTIDGILEQMESNKLYVFANEVYHIDIWEFITTNNAYDEYTLHFKTANPTSGGWMPYFSMPECSWSDSNGVITLQKDSLYELSVVKTTINGTDYFKAIISIFK